MLDSLGMAEILPGCVIMVLQFVGFIAPSPISTLYRRCSPPVGDSAPSVGIDMETRGICLTKLAAQLRSSTP
jgi:hypothetical protein